MQDILLVEDNDANRLIAHAILERDGFSVETAQNGELAVKSSLAKTFDAILLDIMMPGMDGLKTLRRIKSSSNPNKNTPIFALTAYCSPADQTRYRMSGFDGILPKPLKSGQLTTVITQHEEGHVPLAPQSHRMKAANNSTAPWLDQRIINQLQEVKTNDGALQDIQARYWSSIKHALNIINAHQQEAVIGDINAMSEFRGAVHAIKGASATIGLLRASRIAQSLQNAPPGDIPSLLEDLCNCLEDSKSILADALS